MLVSSHWSLRSVINTPITASSVRKPNSNHKKVKKYFFFTNDRSGCDGATIIGGIPRTEAAMAAFSAVILSQINPNFHWYIKKKKKKRAKHPIELFSPSRSLPCYQNQQQPSSMEGGWCYSVSLHCGESWSGWSDVLMPPRIHHSAEGDFPANLCDR